MCTAVDNNVDCKNPARPTQQRWTIRHYVGQREFPAVAKMNWNLTGYWWKSGIDRLVLGGSNAVDVLAAILASADFL